VVRIDLCIDVVRNWLGFVKRITASEESFKIDRLLFELLIYVRGVGCAGERTTLYSVSRLSPLRLIVML
jgi:hypothetical protein